MAITSYLPLLELTRGFSSSGEQTVESVHFGAAAVVDVKGRLVAWIGNQQTITYLRSTAKPFQALPFLERNGKSAYNLTTREIALICASHSGTDAHVKVVQGIQQKTGVHESDLLCGTHPPIHTETANSLRERGEALSQNRHNCSGKHTGMLAFCRMENQPSENYIDPEHPIQKAILKTFAEMCDLTVDQVSVGIDGCSAPNFAVPLYNAALAYARLCDPENGKVTISERADACHTITAAMTSHPDMVGGPGRFDTDVMIVAGGRIVSKGGAEGYQGLGLLPGALGKGSPALGVAIKISDGDQKDRATHAVSLEVLRQLGALSSGDVMQLNKYGPTFPIHNWRKLTVGEARPCFKLNQENGGPSA